jgi:hypothetical protein
VSFAAITLCVISQQVFVVVVVVVYFVIDSVQNFWINPRKLNYINYIIFIDSALVELILGKILNFNDIIKIKYY